jgi:bifunctional DNA-binding transcriptional regulator/antitoxin component of YhaV-PrlF toxin-antitoxin module
MTTLQMRSKGTITFPAKLRKKYKLQEGEVFTIIDLGGGSFLLKPKIFEVDVLSDQIAKRLKEDGVTLEDLLETLREARKELVREKYGDLEKLKGAKKQQ